MKKLFKKFAGLMMGLLAVAGLAGIGANSNEAPVKAEAATTYSVIGTVLGSNWDKDFDMTLNGSTYEVVLPLDKDNEFKVRKDYSWNSSYGYRNELSSLASNSGTNIKIKAKAYYKITYKSGTGVGLEKIDESNVQHWSAIGKINGTNWDMDFPLTYNQDKGRFELKIQLNKDETFKIRYKNSYDIQIAYAGNTGSGISSYLSNDGGNFKVKTAGTYILYVKKDFVALYGDKSYGFGIEQYTPKYFTITHHDENGNVHSTKEVIEESLYFPSFIEKEGYRLVGWYTDQNLTNELVKNSMINQNYDLYPKYEKVEDFTIYFKINSTLGTSVCAYLYRDSTDGENNKEWPGVAMIEEEGYWKLTVDASKSYSKIIFNDGKAEGSIKTENLDLIYNSANIYYLGSKNSGGEYNATTKIVVAATSKENQAVGFYYLSDESYEEVTDTLATSQKQYVFEKYMSTVSTCDDWAKVEEFAALAEGLNTEVEIDDKEGKVTIQNKIEFMRTWKAIQEGNGETPELGSNLLSNITSSNNILIVLIVGLLGLTTVGAYYFLNKKKYAK